MTLSQNSLNNGARWSVLWLGKKGMVEKKFDEDFGGALKAYTLLLQHGKRLVTLRCCNVGFAPPLSITQHEVIRYEVITRKGKKYKRKVYDAVDLMETKYNPAGVWWCPYCIKLRPFKHVRDWTGREHMQCPVCKITERDFWVRRYNPQAKIIEYTRRRRGRRSRRRI